MTARHYSNYQNLIISIDYSWFLAKTLSNFLSLPWKLHNRHCHNYEQGRALLHPLMFLQIYAPVDFSKKWTMGWNPLQRKNLHKNPVFFTRYHFDHRLKLIHQDISSAHFFLIVDLRERGTQFVLTYFTRHYFTGQIILTIWNMEIYYRKPGSLANNNVNCIGFYWYTFNKLRKRYEMLKNIFYFLRLTFFDPFLQIWLVH